MQTIEKNHESVLLASQSPCKEVRILDECPIGYGGDQGDLLIRRIAQVPEGAILVSDRQLAPGTTQGSRHTVSARVKVYKPSNFGQAIRTGSRDKTKCRIQGLIVQDSQPITFEHPEHADHIYPLSLIHI